MGKGTRLPVLALAVFAVGCLAHRLAAQTPAANTDYSKEAAVIETYRTAATFQNDGTSSRDLTLRARINSDAGVQQYSVLIFPYASASDKVKIDYVRVIHPGGATVVTPPESIQDESSAITRQAPEYSDYREKHVAVKGLGPGDVLEYHVEYETSSPLVPGQFWFADDFDTSDIVLDEELQVSVPEERAVKIRSATVQPTVTEGNDHRIYLWKTRNLKRKEARHYQVGTLPAPDVLVSSFQSWAQVGGWWKGLEAPRMVPTPQITAKAAALTKGLATEAAKLRAIYSFVALNLHYISVSFGIGRYQPHAAAEVLNNQYGDCKDQQTLLASLLQAVGIQAWPALINSSRQLDPAVPSPGQFDHVITVVRQGQKLVWMDTTTEVAPLGLLAPPLHDKQALVMPDGTPPYLAETPTVLPQDNFVHMDVDAKVAADGTLTAKLHDSAGGDRGLIMRMAFRAVPEAQWKDLVQGISRLEGYGGTVSDVTAGSPEDTDHPFKWAYDYTRKDYPDWKNHRITAPLPPMALPELSDDKQQGSQPVLLGGLGERHYHARTKLPAGYLPMLPARVDLTKPYADYHAEYSFQNGVLEVERDLTVKSSQVASADREDYRAFQKAVSDDESRYIPLTVVSGGSAEAASPRIDFQSEIRTAFAESKQRNFRAALDSINRALQVNPDSESAWELAGALHMELREPDDAIAAARQAIRLAPNDYHPCLQLTQMLRAARKEDEVVPLWRDFIQRNPQDPVGYANLGYVLVSEGKYSDAIPQIETAARLNPKEWRFDVVLGTALAKTGDKTGAANAYEKAAELNPTPETQNDAGYFMADAGVNLPEAERLAVLAVRTEEIKTAYIPIDNFTQGDLRLMPFLAAYWDTLGWVYFREGKLEEARKYAAASFQLEQTALVADHLGQIDEKLGRRADAIREDAMVISLSPKMISPSGAPVTMADDPLVAAARERLTHLVGKGAALKSAISKATDELSAARTYRLSKVGRKPGTAGFFLLFSAGEKTVQVKFITGSENLRAASDRIAAMHFRDPFPDAGPARIIRKGTLSCSEAVSTCDFVLYPPESVTR